MIHFTCDCCGRVIQQASETRYVVRMEVYAAIEDDPAHAADEADHLEEIEDLLERIDDLEEVDDSDHHLYKQVRYDLCVECRERFLQNPLGRGATRMGYSDN